MTQDLAVVTGASSGIGREIARVLAAKKIDLVLVARRVDRLKELAEELCSQHGVMVEVIPADLSLPNAADHLVAELHQRQLSTSILINCAGFGYYGPMLQRPPEEVELTIQVNVMAVARLVRLLAAEMTERGRGHILNVASFAALQPIPRYCIYSAAKAFVVAMSLSLRHELRRTGVRVSVICPGFTDSEFHQVAEHEKSKVMRLTTLQANHVARAGVAGMFRGKGMIVPGLWYKLNALLGRLLPATVGTSLSAIACKN